MRTVVVTGLGAVTAAGADVAALEDALWSARSAITPVTLFDTSGSRTQLAAWVDMPDALDATGRPISRPDFFALAATREAVTAAGLSAADLASAALIFGTGTGGARLTEGYMAATQLSPLSALLPHQPSSVTDLVGRAFGIFGPRSTIMTACSSSATAIGDAADRILSGDVEVALAGGAEGLCRLTFAGFSALRATATEACRPFDVARKGLTLGEGAAVLVLEEESFARARGAKILAQFAGWGISADAHHMTAPHPAGDGARRAMLAAMSDAHLSADDIDYINAHGTATPANDAAESAAISAALGARAAQIPISSIKSIVGHTLGAAGAVEAVASVLALLRQRVPPTVNLQTPDPAFGLDFVPGAARDATLRAVLSNSFAFGGNNTVLAFRRA